MLFLALVVASVTVLLGWETEESGRRERPDAVASRGRTAVDPAPKDAPTEAGAAIPDEPLAMPAAEPPTFDLVVTVVEADGRPAAGTDVWIVVHDTYLKEMFGDAKDPRPPKGRARTDDRGNARLTLPVAGSWGVHALAARGTDAGISDAIHVRGTGARSLRVQLARGVPVRVRVTNSLGHVVPGCTVDMVVPDPIATGFSSIGPYGSWVPPVRADGRAFEFPTAPEQRSAEAVFLRVRADGYLAGDCYLKLDAAREGTVEVVLRRAVRIEGRLVNTDGNPIAGGRVTYVRDNPWKTRRIDGDAHGRFVVPDAQDSGGRLTVRGPGTRVREVEIPATTRDVIELGDIRLPAAQWISGRVVDRYGAPVADVEVYVRESDAHRGSRSTRSDSAGRFRAASLSNRPHQVYATEGSTSDWEGRTGRARVPAPGVDEVEVVLSGALLLEVHVAFAEGDAPGPARPYLHVWARRQGAPAGSGASIDTWSRGRYRLRYKAKSSGRHDFRVEMPGYVTVAREIEISGEHETRVDVTLRRTPPSKPK